ncbi:MAG: cation:proton antiporter [Gracilibacteraceae bacterium]|nr:cation:proton antiporter [Gracilibacteraceae bacterium]
MEYNFLELGVLLLFVAFSGIVASRLKFSIVPIIIIVGLLLPPNGLTSYQPSASTLDAVDFLGRLGVLFLLFSLGLEFSIRKLLQSAGTMVKSGLIYLAFNATAAVVFTFFLGWGIEEILLATGIIIISSSAIVAKTLVDLKRTANPETEVIMGLMLFQDIFMAAYLPIVSAIAINRGGKPSELAISVGFAFAVIIIFVFVSLRTTKVLESIFSIASEETFLLVVLALLIFLAGASEALNISEAIGALILGMILADTSQHERIVRLVVPFRDFFGAAFFFGFALKISLDSLLGAVLIAVIAVALTIAGSLAYGFTMGKVAGLSKRGALNLGLTITSRGEFSIVLANLGVAAGLSTKLESFSVLYVVLLAVLGPLLSRWSEPVYQLLAPRLGWKRETVKGKHHHKVMDASLLKDKQE